jgi:hypothetical protein
VSPEASSAVGPILVRGSTGRESFDPGGGRDRGGRRITVTRALGLTLVVFTLVPMWRMLREPGTGLAGAGTVQATALTVQFLLWGTIATALLALIVGRTVPARRLEAGLRRLARTLCRPGSVVFAAGLALVSGVCTLAFSLLVLHGKPNLVDAMAQLLQARYWAAGRLAGPADMAAFYQVQNSLVTPAGWVSQYPPGQVALLAAGFRAGAVWLVGPALMAVTAFLTARIAEILLPGRRAVARVGAALAALSPFAMGLAGAYMNHVTAAAFTAGALLCALRLRTGRWYWALLGGFYISGVWVIRPLAAVDMAAPLTLAVWLGAGSGVVPGRRRLIQWLGLAAAGAAPLFLAQAAYNLHFFGAPFRFGYLAANGPAVGLGLHLDPWGNVYGLREVLGYTASDLVALSGYLLETPIPIVAVIGLYLMLAPALPRAEKLIVAWALLPVLGNAFYWHHGLWMGPRMLAEAAPAWGLLAAVAAAGLVRLTPARVGGARFVYWPRSAVAGGLGLALLAGLFVLGPQRLAGYTGLMPSTRLEAVGPARSVVFVHGGWTSRLAMRLAGAGMRLDSVETALRENSTCAVESYVAWRTGETPTGQARRAPEAGPAARLELNPAARPMLVVATLAPTDRARLTPGERLEGGCREEAFADRGGVIDVSPLTWQGDLPGVPGRGAVFVRDLGPAMNARLLALMPDRTPFVLLSRTADGTPHIEPYAAAMAWLWVAPGRS